MLSSSTVISPGTLKSVAKQVVIEEELSRNLMIFGKAEVAGEDVTETVTEVLHEMNEKPRLVECMRVGTIAEGKSRPIKVKLSSSDAVFNILRNAKKLKNSVSNCATFIGPDRSKEEQAAHKKFVDKMKTMMRDEPDKYHYIRKGGITSVKKL